jgi:hypothetical protein
MFFDSPLWLIASALPALKARTVDAMAIAVRLALLVAYA